MTSIRELAPHDSAEHGIVTIDTGFHRPVFDAAYLVIENGRAAFIDCGTQHSIPALLDALARHGLTPAEVDWLILTHVHLDHAGGAGALMQRLPNARLVVHPRGAAHMIDPSRLVAGATAVYGAEEMARSYGEIVPVPAPRVVVAEDGHVVDLAGRALLCVDTPGHARHHLCVWDERSRGWFTGDTFGLSYREFDSAHGPFIVPTSSPVQFEPEPLKASIRTLLARDPDWMYITHYGRIGDTQRLGADLIEQIDAMVRMAREAQSAGDGLHARLTESLADYFVERAQAHASPISDEQTRAVLAVDVELNAQGLAIWLARAG
ncbi:MULTISPECIES: MBL fold metallo-hydrolase [unclassified Lysobacter]|uniref:MBL fold metallo-hydrolase n=1 Tax=unclassified Lysobacter TaxID=2635362 RepID=UPI001BECDD0A|nr:MULTISPECIES: MBL fold metallo-hydrolase [unclassified Lysobacter]MBT2745639.1 MBL fold metallo-hydrolase [Lysobacter sp. ISL-42]MBT2753578.1 MBL fold metallo-hydrolase [Lysobacter sp. ISL-50]MBT2777038.1 MBL fold metallo-hydrolase [Lysobacter sp. ISL-54]MBT2780336.1 MBL fold metallo-hydrolase [Lysobacter sp. ISL-52]